MRYDYILWSVLFICALEVLKYNRMMNEKNHHILSSFNRSGSDAIIIPIPKFQKNTDFLKFSTILPWYFDFKWTKQIYNFNIFKDPQLVKARAINV